MGGYDVVFRAEARDEALNAASYIAEHYDLEAALLWYDGLERSLKTLTEMPARCPLAPESHAFSPIEVRHLLYKRHRILFTIRETTVHMLHVRHMSQQALSCDDLEES